MDDLPSLQPSGNGADTRPEPPVRRWAALAAALAILAAGLVGCSSISIAASPSEHQLADQLPVYTARNDGAPTAGVDLGPVEGYGCQPQRDFPPNADAQRADALDQLRLRALRVGADAVVGVSYSAIQTDRRNVCFHGLVAHGEAFASNKR